MSDDTPRDDPPSPPDPVSECWIQALVAQARALDQAVDDSTRRALVWGFAPLLAALEGRLDERSVDAVGAAAPPSVGSGPDGPGLIRRWAPSVLGLVAALGAILGGEQLGSSSAGPGNRSETVVSMVCADDQP